MAEQDSGDAGSAADDPVVVAPAPVAPTAKAPRNTGFLGGVLGGVMATAAGFALLQYAPGIWPVADTSELQSQIAAQQADSARIQTELAALSAAKPDETLVPRLTAVEEKLAAPTPQADLTAFEDRISALETRMTALEAMPMGEGGVAPAQIMQQDAAIAELRQQMQQIASSGSAQSEAAVKEALGQAQAASDALRAEAEQMVASIEKTAALGRVQAALDLGGPFDAVLPALGEVPAALSDHAATGIPTLKSLQTSFPPAARAALDAALRANMGESWTDRFTTFLRSQSGARSLEPRAGTDPDAVLSRAEAALTAGDLATALTELATLPQPSQLALADWLAAAQQRQAAVDAVAALIPALQQ